LFALAALGVAVDAPAATAATFRPGPGTDPSGGATMDPFFHLGSRALRTGHTGHDVKVAQDFLTRAGLKIRRDGRFGRSTARVVRRFERRTGLRVDGRLSRIDIARLRATLVTGLPPAPTSETPGEQAKLNPDGTATVPASAPGAVKKVIAAANQIAKKPYLYGGGHARFPQDRGYDCSGSVSYALYGGRLLKTPMASGGFTSYGADGPGRWISTYAHGGHMYMVVAGLRFDTSGKRATGSRWQTAKRSPSGFTVRHPVGL